MIKTETKGWTNKEVISIIGSYVAANPNLTLEQIKVKMIKNGYKNIGSTIDLLSLHFKRDMNSGRFVRK